MLQKILKQAVDRSFNRITIDGDMSTNDSVLFLANGNSGLRIDDENKALQNLFSQAVEAVCSCLARKCVFDGEKVTKFVRLRNRSPGSFLCREGRPLHRQLTFGQNLLVWIGPELGKNHRRGRLCKDRAGLQPRRLVLRRSSSLIQGRTDSRESGPVGGRGLGQGIRHHPEPQLGYR